MPRQLKEIKNFNLGTILNVSEKDTPKHSSVFSLNINPVSENGILTSINCDRLFLPTPENTTTASSPMSWNSVNNTSTSSLADLHKFHIDDITIFEEKSSANLSYIGTKGSKENVIATDIRPWYEKIIALDGSQLTFYPSSTIALTDDNIPYLSNTNAIALSAPINGGGTTFVVTSGFTDGTAVLTATNHDESQYDGKTMTMTTPDGKVVVYEFDNQTGGGAAASGALIGSNTCIQLYGAASAEAIIDQIEIAIANATYGHGTRISLSQATGVLTLTYAQEIIPQYLSPGNYFSLATGSYAGNEVMKVESVDVNNNKIYIKRGCFGTPIESYAASTKFFVYSNRMTIDGLQTIYTRGIFNIVNESQYSGNHIGGNSSYLSRSTTAVNNVMLGGTIASGSYNVSYDSTAKTISIAGISSVPFYEGDTINVYHSDTSTSNGFSAKILKITGSSPIVLTLNTAPPTTETENSDTVYIEANLLKNHTFTHKEGTSGSLASTYACNDWTKHRLNKYASADRYSNGYQSTTSSNVAIVISGGGYWETSLGNIDLGGTTDNAGEFYPFIDNDVYLKIVSVYENAGSTGTVALTNALVASSSDVTLILSRNVNNLLAAGDILNEGNEYMKVISVKDRQAIVQRGYFNTDVIAHSATAILKKCVNYLARQTISKDLLKPGQDYSLSFYARIDAVADVSSHAALSISFNGGHINAQGHWVSPLRDVSKGYIGDNPKDLAKEDRWIDFKDLDRPNSDTALDTSDVPTPCAMDDNWRKFALKFSLPKGVELTTDVELDLCARGKDTDAVWIDLIDLMEDTKLIYANKNSLLKTNVLLDNGGIKDLVSYDSIKRKLQIITSIFEEPTLKKDFIKSPFAATTITSSIEDASIVVNNREAHIGFGGGKGDTSPQWLGYPGHKLFDSDYTSELYQDEDTVHRYDGDSTSGNNFSKICLAGEHERLVATWSDGNADLTIAHTTHSMNIGDNIVIRQYKDVSNSWDGSGVWIVESTTTNAFVCVRATTYDANPTVAGANEAFDTNSDGTKDNAESLISYRPYFYYGIKDGDNCIYRIWPDARIKGGGSGDTSLGDLDTTYTKGKIERSLPVDTQITSISTCYNKKADGTGGGRVYILSKISNQVLSYNVEVKYDEWEEKSLNKVAEMDLVFRSFKWSNDHITGDIGGDTEVFGGLSVTSSPAINYAGLLSDIIETKAPNNTLDFDETTNAGYAETMFDTRLWIQSRSDEAGFSEGDRFLFCALTNDTNTDGPDILYCADRTPPTTMVTNVYVNPPGYIAGPGLDPAVSKRSYFWSAIHSGGGNDGNLDTIAPVTDSEGNYGAIINGEGSGFRPYINFGHNVGWDAGEDNNNQLSIKVAKYGLFQMADNNGDGVIDGTGLVSPNDITMTSTTEGPYGKYHQHVCGHAVGLIGGSNLNWVKHWGRMHNVKSSSGSENYFITNFGDGPTQDAPELMKADKCIFVSSDTHYGDDQPDEEYTFNAVASVDSNKMSELTIDSSNGVAGLNIGDAIYLTNLNVATIISIVDRSNNKITVTTKYLDFTGASVTSGSIYPYAIHDLHGDDNKGGVYAGGEAFHWSFDSTDPLNGDIFTIGEGSGHYTKTYMTPPAYWGGPKGTSGHFDKNINPGFLWKVEKLSFRAGVMIRPFDMDDDDFNDLIIGNGISVDMPCYPNPVYHTKQSTKLHYDVDNTGSNNAFASKLFITCPIKNDDEQRSKIYICDMDFLYPSEGLQIPKENTSGNGNTNDINFGTSWDILISGIIKDYEDTTEALTLEGDNDERPCIHIDTDEITYDSTDDLSLFNAGSQYRDLTNSLAGLCISIKDATTGMVQTRYIVGSFKLGDNTGDDMIVKVHYPFAHTPANDDQFWIWSHANAATAPVRLHKTKTLPHGLGDAILSDPILGNKIYKKKGELSIADSTAICTDADSHNLTTNDIIKFIDMNNATYEGGVHKIVVTGPTTFTSTTVANATGSAVTGNWILLTGKNETASSNPLTMQLTAPIIRTTFGGLDMRKTRTYNVNTVSSASSSEQRLHIDNPATHLLTTGDTITYNAGGGNELDGTYNIDKADDDEIDITTTATDTDSGTVYTNQWEAIMSDTTSNANMGEIRAGFTNWDKGDITGNVLRYDSTADADRYIAYGDSSIKIESVSLPDQSGDYFLANNTYYYKVSFIYDGYQEGPLSNSHWVWTDTFTRAKLALTINVTNVSRRLTAVCIYRKDSVNSLYSLVEEIPTDSGWNKSAESYSYTISDSGTLGATYEARSGISEVLDTIKIKYGISSELDGYLFVGDCSHEEIENASNLIFRSKPGKYSIFDYANDFATLKGKPTAFANFNGRLYTFDKSNIYRINPESLIIEDIYEGIGCFGKDSLVVTEEGMYFADTTGAYFHNGQRPIKISESIQKGGAIEESFGGTDNIRDLSWDTITKNNPKAKPYVFYDANINCVLFNVEILDNDSTYNTPLLRQYIWAYNMSRQVWNLWELAEDSEIGKPFTSDNGEVLIPINNAIYESRGGATKRDYTWVSKKLTMDEDSIMKVFNKIKLNGLSEDLNLGGNYLESSDRLLVVTSTGSLSSNDVTYSKTATESSDYKLSGTNKKGRWVQLKLENVKEDIDSIGIIFRRKSTK